MLPLMDRKEAERILYDALQADESVRSNAEKQIKALIVADFTGFLSTFGQIMLDNATPLKIRHIASIIIKNSFHSNNARIQRGFEHNWLGCPEQLRHDFIGVLKTSLGSTEAQVLSNVSKILGSIIRIELVNNVPNRHIDDLLSLIPYKEYAVGVCKTMAVASDQLYDETDYAFEGDMEKIFRIATFYFADAGAGEAIRLATLGCVYSSLDIYAKVFKDKAIRDEFLFNISKCRGEDEEVVEKMLEVLNKFVDVCHQFLQKDLPALCQFCSLFFDEGPEAVRMQAFEFWQVLAELEYNDLMRQNFPALLPKLFSFLTKEDACETEWTEHKAAAFLLTALAERFENEILGIEAVQDFVAKKLQAPDPGQHAVGAVALGCICSPGFSEFLYSLLAGLLADIGHDVCRNEALYALARICERALPCTANFLPSIIEKCSVIVSNSTDSSVNATWVIHAILASVKEQPLTEAEQVIHYHYTDMLTLMIGKLNGIRPDEYDLRNALIVTLSELISLCPKGLASILENLNSYLANKINETVQALSGASTEQAMAIEDILSSYVVLLEASLRVAAPADSQGICQLFAACLQAPENKSYGEIYIAASSLLSFFSSMLGHLIPFVLRDIESKDAFISKSALNMLSDCATHMENRFVEFTPAAIPALISTISSPNTPFDIKPRVIEVFGHVALAIGKSFEPYLEMSIVLFGQINSLERIGDEEYVDSLRKSVLRLFNYILVAVGKTEETRLRIDDIMRLVGQAVIADYDGSYQKEAVDVLFDAKALFGTRTVNHTWVRKFLKAVLSSKHEDLTAKANAIYADLY